MEDQTDGIETAARALLHHPQLDDVIELLRWISTRQTKDEAACLAAIDAFADLNGLTLRRLC